MTEIQDDRIVRMFDQLALLTARLMGLKALGLMDEAFRDIENLEQEAGRLDPVNREKLRRALAELRRQAEG